MSWRRAERDSNMDEPIRESGPARGGRQTAAHSRVTRRPRQRGQSAKSHSTNASGSNGASASISSPTPDEDDRDAEPLGGGQRDAALGAAVELGEHDAGHPHLAAEALRLEDAVLPGRRVEDEQDVPRLIRQAALDDAADLRQLVHELLLVLEPAGRVDQHGIEPSRLRRRHGVEGDRARIGARPLGDDRARRAARPRRAAARSPPRGTCQRRQAPGSVPRPCRRCASLAMVVVLPVPLTPTNRITDGAAPSSKRSRPGPGQAIADLGAQRATRVLAAPAAVALEAGARGLDELEGRGSADVGGDERLLDLVPGRLGGGAIPAPRIVRSRAPRPDGRARSPMPAGSRMAAARWPAASAPRARPPARRLAPRAPAFGGETPRRRPRPGRRPGAARARG